MDWGERRYSTMTQIDPSNVGKLALAWSFELGPGGGNQQATNAANIAQATLHIEASEPRMM